MTTYYIMVSEFFPKKHSKEGKETNFKQSILDGTKIHTIRANFDLWQKRFKKINEGKAVLSLRSWDGVPYHSKQVEFKLLKNTDGIGIEKLDMNIDFFRLPLVSDFVYKNSKWINRGHYLSENTLAKNDGLEVADFIEWFKPYDLSKPMAIIHFTDFRYIK